MDRIHSAEKRFCVKFVWQDHKRTPHSRDVCYDMISGRMSCSRDFIHDGPSSHSHHISVYTPHKQQSTGALTSRNSGAAGTRVCNQTAVLGKFREGAINALFSTSVAEEGLDVQNCSIVVCYDVPKRPLSAVQTIGRARARESEVFFMQPVQPWDGRSPSVRPALLTPPKSLILMTLQLKHALNCAGHAHLSICSIASPNK